MFTPFIDRSTVEANNVNTLVDAIIRQLMERDELRGLIDPLKIEDQFLLDNDGNYIDKVIPPLISSLHC